MKSTWGYPVDRKKYNSYICGITPYDATHLGHAATYITFDLIHRYQLLLKKNLNFIENVTDVDDPLLERANRDGVDWKELADSQIALFQRDMTALHILPPKTFLSVSETVDLVIEGILNLQGTGKVYEIDGDYYFEIGNSLKELPMELEEAIKIFGERGGDPNRAGKHHKLDPLLWRKNSSGEPGWESPFGFGRPGWHIECVVIALAGCKSESDVSAEPILDLQGGGTDLIFPHHFMTKVIAEEISKRTFAAEYIHTGLIGLDGEKMSKSRGNLVFVHKLLEDGIDPMIIRFALLKEHYANERMWSNALLESAEIEVAKIRSVLSKIEVVDPTPYIELMIKDLADDLNTENAINSLLKWCEESDNGGSGANPGAMARFLDSALGLAL